MKNRIDSQIKVRVDDGRRITGYGNYSGLCKTCIKRHSCTFIRENGQSVLECEEFVLDEKYNMYINDSDYYKNEIDKYDYNEDIKGLCINCAKYGDCKYEKPAGGVWHCDEYC